MIINHNHNGHSKRKIFENEKIKILTDTKNDLEFNNFGGCYCILINLNEQWSFRIKSGYQIKKLVHNPHANLITGWISENV